MKDLDKFNAITKALLGYCQIGTFNPLIHKVLKWSDTLESKCCKIFKVSGHFRTLCIKKLTKGC